MTRKTVKEIVGDKDNKPAFVISDCNKLVRIAIFQTFIHLQVDTRFPLLEREKLKKRLYDNVIGTETVYFNTSYKIYIKVANLFQEEIEKYKEKLSEELTKVYKEYLKSKNKSKSKK